MNKTKFLFLSILLLLTMLFFKIELIPIVRATATIVSDSWEDGSMSPEWEECGDVGLGFKVVTHRVRTGSYAIQSDFDIGTDCRLNMTLYPFDSSLLYLTVYCYINGSDPSTLWSNKIFAFFTGTGEGISVEYINYTGNLRKFRLHDEWSGAYSYGSHELTKDTWHKLYFIARGEGGQCDFYFDDMLDASMTPANMAGKNHTEFWLDEWDNALYDTFFDDLLLMDGTREIIDSYPESHANDYVYLADVHPSDTWGNSAYCQTFTVGTSSEIEQANFSLAKYGDITGHLRTEVCNIADNKPVGEPLAVSDLVDVATLTTTPSFSLITFDFTGENQICLDVGDYGIVIVAADGNFDASNQVYVAVDITPEDDGVGSCYNWEFCSDWCISEDWDMIFYVLGQAAGAGSEYECRVKSIPELNVEWELDSNSYSTPWNDNVTEGSRTFLCSDFEVSVNSSYKYTFDHWSINGSGYYGSLSIDVEIEGETNLTMHYIGSWIASPYVPTFAHDALNGIWYFRSDTHTIHEILAYRLDSVNSNTATYDSRSIAGSCNVSYGIRVWILDMFGNNYELSGGSPEAIVTRTSDGEGIQSAYFECPAHAGLIDAVQVNLYQRFNTEPWSLRRYFITDEDLYIKLPASSWTIHYYTNRTTASTTAYFYHGSTTFNSRILFQYYRANPWELALARLQAQNYLAFMTTPWTYYLGDIFWSLLLLFGIVTMYNRVGSLKPILALLWLLGGVGSVLSALVPALVLHIAWLMLAVAMGLTLFKLIYR